MLRITLIALTLTILVAPVGAQTATEKKATIEFLQALQLKDGGFTPTSIPRASPDDQSLRATSSGIRAIKYFGGEVKDRKAAAEFVRSCFDKKAGAFADRPGGKPEVAVTAVGLMAVVELKLPLEDYLDGAVKYLQENAKTFDEIRIAVAGFEAIGKKSAKNDAWIKEVEKLRNKDGVFGKDLGQARDTGSAVAALLRMGAKIEQRDAVLKALRDGQRDDSGFGKADAKTSDLESSYRIMRVFYMLKEKPKDEEKLRGFIARCRNKDGGYGVAPGERSSVSATYYAAIILHWLEQK